MQSTIVALDYHEMVTMFLITYRKKTGSHWLCVGNDLKCNNQSIERTSKSVEKWLKEKKLQQASVKGLHKVKHMAVRKKSIKSIEFENLNLINFLNFNIDNVCVLVFFLSNVDTRSK